MFNQNTSRGGASLQLGDLLPAGTWGTWGSCVASCFDINLNIAFSMRLHILPLGSSKGENRNVVCCSCSTCVMYVQQGLAASGNQHKCLCTFTHEITLIRKCISLLKDSIRFLKTFNNTTQRRLLKLHASGRPISNACCCMPRITVVSVVCMSTV